MRMGLVIYGSLDTLSGGYLYDRQLVAALHRRQHEVAVYARPWRSYANHLGDNVNQAWLEELRTAPVELMLQDELNHPSLLRANLRLRGRLPYKIVALVHHLRCCEPEHPPLLRFLYAQIERLYLNSVDAVLCNSHTTMAAVTDRLWRPLPTHVAAPGANHLPAPVESPAVVTADGGLRVLAVGNVSRRKQIHVVVAALCQLPAAVRWSLTIAGRTDVEPGYTAQVQAQIAAGAAAARVTWAGRLTDDELVAAYRSHDLLALPISKPCASGCRSSLHAAVQPTRSCATAKTAFWRRRATPPLWPRSSPPSPPTRPCAANSAPPPVPATPPTPRGKRVWKERCGGWKELAERERWV
jgi:glycosyltransferase involved in cell wall biosynthesis